MNTPPSTTARGHSLMHCWLTACKYCLCSHHSYSCQRTCRHYRMPRQTESRDHVDPTPHHAVCNVKNMSVARPHRSDLQTTVNYELRHRKLYNYIIQVFCSLSNATSETLTMTHWSTASQCNVSRIAAVMCWFQQIPVMSWTAASTTDCSRRVTRHRTALP